MQPMDEVILPLTSMGAKIKGRMNKYLPINRSSAEHKLKAINYELPVASAQVKSAPIVGNIIYRR